MLSNGERISQFLILSTDGVFNTFQGEGPRLGQNTTFIRLAGCNLSCNWCDTAYTWDWKGKNGHKYLPTEETQRTSVEYLARWVMGIACSPYGPSYEARNVEKVSLTITGGEPLLQYKSLGEFFQTCYAHNLHVPIREVNFETNGTISPDWNDNVWQFAQEWNFVISPKLKNAGPESSVLGRGAGAIADLSILLLGLRKFQEKMEAWDLVTLTSSLKFVCESPDDLVEIQALLEELRVGWGFTIPPHNIYIMAQGVDPGQTLNKTRELADDTRKLGWNLTTRFHQQLWGNARGQ